MRVRVLGCSGAIAHDCKTTAFLVGQDTLIDAGTGLGDLTCEEMLGIDHVFLTHAHLDHVVCLPLMVDTVATARRRPLRVYALPETLAALRAHIFNDLIWPDFTRLPSPQAPFVTFHPIETGRAIRLPDRIVEPLPAVHTVPAVGFAVRDLPEDSPWWVFSGDTESNPAFWQRVNQMKVGALVIETAFSNRESNLARAAKHLSPAVLADELDCIAPEHCYPIYITHTKPTETATIMCEIAQFDRVRPPRAEVAHDIRCLSGGHVFEW